MFVYSHELCSTWLQSAITWLDSDTMRDVCFSDVGVILAQLVSTPQRELDVMRAC